MFIAEFNVARNIQAIEVSLRSLCARMGIDYFCLMIFLPSAIQRPDIRILNGCPDEWARTYREQGLWAVDPVVRKGMTQGAPILWANIIAECLDQQDSEGLAMMFEARQCGMRDGITFPWHGAHGQVGLLSLSRDRSIRKNNGSRFVTVWRGWLLTFLRLPAESVSPTWCIVMR